MEAICNFLNKVINPAIGGLAVIELTLFVYSLYLLVKLKSRINKLTEPTKTVNKTKKVEKEVVEKTIEVEVKRDWDEFDNFLKDYQSQGSWYSVFSLGIQIFTLLGILGTVAGLYLAMRNGQDMYVGVELALSSTILGIICAVFFKVLDIILCSAIINPIEGGIDRYEKIYKVDSDDANLSAVMNNKNN